MTIDAITYLKLVQVKNSFSQKTLKN